MGMRIDAHQHFWEYQKEEYSWISENMSQLRRDFLPLHLVPHLQNTGIGGSVAVQARQHEQETTFLLHLSQQHAFIKGIVGWVDLQSTALPQRLDYFSQFPKLCGFRHVLQDEPEPEMMLHKEFLRGIGSLEKYGFTYDLLIYHPQLPLAISLVKKFPHQKFVVDHLAKPEIRMKSINAWKKDLRLLSEMDNVWCKISGLVTEANWMHWQYEDIEPYLETALEAFGEDRCMFGSDWPVCLLAADYHEVVQTWERFTSGWSPELLDKVWGQNAINFYHLKI